MVWRNMSSILTITQNHQNGNIPPRGTLVPVTIRSTVWVRKDAFDQLQMQPTSSKVKTIRKIQLQINTHSSSRILFLFSCKSSNRKKMHRGTTEGESYQIHQLILSELKNIPQCSGVYRIPTKHYGGMSPATYLSWSTPLIRIDFNSVTTIVHLIITWMEIQTLHSST